MPTESRTPLPHPCHGRACLPTRAWAAEFRSVALCRIITVGLALLGGEILARLVFESDNLPRGRWLALDTLARLGRLAALATIAWLGLASLSLVAARSAAARRVAEAGSWARDYLCTTVPALRMLALFAVANVALTPLAAQRYQLAWRAASVFTCAVVALGSAIELGMAARRAGRRIADLDPVATHAGGLHPTSMGRLLWSVEFAFLGFLVFPRIAGFQLAVAGVAFLLVTVAPVIRLQRPVVAALGAAALLGLAVDVRMPSQRRFASVHAPFSALGLTLLRRLTDFDGDGSSGLLGLDCDDFDPRRSPTAEDWPGNGVDEDCSGADARLVPPPRVSAPSLASESRPRPDVFLVTVDALRADALAWMPRTSRWAERCIRFEQARTASNFTSLSISALLTGTESRYLRSDYRIAIVPPSQGADAHSQSQPPTLATMLRRAGYFGSAVVPFQPPLLFLFHGFDDVRVPPSRRVTTPASEVLSQARAAIQRKPAGRPFLLWTHLLDTHAPYLGGTQFADYRRAAGALDGQLADFLDALPAEALVVLTADHGEAFGEHGSYTHESTLFDEELRVPLVLCAPEAAGLGPPRGISALVSTLDVTPTLIDLADAGQFESLGGRSLVPFLRNAAPEPHAYVRFESWLPDHHLQGVVAGCHKWMRDLDAEWEALFDLCADPSERDDIAGRHPGIVRSLRGLVFESAAVVPSWIPKARALGAEGARSEAGPGYH
jgi:hypothetical protein